jgi:bifunctional DNA-binding transcriptional regulator/antitoxin component of YhaV-PrlF toxin-antitoxin module
MYYVTRLFGYLNKIYEGARAALPPGIIEAMNWKIGDSVEVYAEESKVIVKKL